MVSFSYLSFDAKAISYDVSSVGAGFSPSVSSGYSGTLYYSFPQFPNGSYYHGINSSVRITNVDVYTTQVNWGFSELNITFNIPADGVYYIYLPKPGGEGFTAYTNVSIDGGNVRINADLNMPISFTLFPLTDVNNPLNLTMGTHLAQLNNLGSETFVASRIVLVRQFSNFCGDGVCDSVGSYVETYQSCPQDCPNCDDGNNRTYDYFNYSSRQCSHTTMACLNDSDCNDGKNYTIDSCANPGSPNAVCVNTPVPNICGNGVCEPNYGESCNTCVLDCGCPSNYQCTLNATGNYVCSYTSGGSLPSTTNTIAPSTAAPSQTVIQPASTTTNTSTAITTNLSSSVTVVQSCPSSCDDQNPCSTDYCSASTGYQCRHDSIPNCKVPTLVQQVKSGESGQVTIQSVSTSISQNGSAPQSIPAFLQKPIMVNLTIDNSIGSSDLAKVKVDVDDAVKIANVASKVDNISSIRVAKSGDNVTYLVESTKNDRFLFFDVQVPQNVTVDAVSGNVLSMQRGSAFDVFVGNVIKAIFFWTK